MRNTPCWPESPPKKPLIKPPTTNHFEPKKYFYLWCAILGSIVFFFILAPFFSKGAHARFVLDLSLMSMLILSVYICSSNRKYLATAIILAVPAVLRLFFPSTEVDEITLMFNAAFFAFVIGILIRQLFTTTYVTKDVICAALSVYFLVGVLYGIMFTLLECFFSGSFFLPQPIENYTFYSAFGQDLIYFSFVTLTTSGYGDIVPLSPPAKFLSILEAITGQIYLTVMIARLIGIHISQLKH
ncbi:MAG: hypothetical protein HYX35_03395 [Proteobacteria bacterium]|nr:hypothetical protein [Pseudomonadota bacterium]